MPKSLESRPRVKSYEAWSFFKWNQQNCNHTLAYTRMSLCKCGTLQVWQSAHGHGTEPGNLKTTNSLLRTFIRKFLRWKHPRKIKFVPHWKMAYCCLVISSPSYYFGFHHLSVIFSCLFSINQSPANALIPGCFPAVQEVRSPHHSQQTSRLSLQKSDNWTRLLAGTGN